MAEVLPLLYLHGLSTKDFVPALAEFFGTSAGLSAAAITRLTTSWSAEREAFMSRNLSEVDSPAPAVRRARDHSRPRGVHVPLDEHSHAVALLTARVDVRTAAGRLGHTPAVLLRTYAHFVRPADQAAAERLEQFLR